MGNIFSGGEIVELGIQIERNGKAFYDTLIKRSGDEKAKDIFKYLSGEEAKHIGVFEKILKSVGEYTPPEAYPGEYYAYMNALAGQYVFTKKGKGEEMARNVKTDLEGVDLGIKFEKDSIIFYEGMRRVVPEHDHKLLGELIRQEEGHLKQLNDLKKAL